MDSTIDCLDTVAFRTSSVYCAVSTVSMVCMDGIWKVKSGVSGCGLGSHKRQARLITISTWLLCLHIK